MPSDSKKFITSPVCGFCRGVRMALAVFEETCCKYGKPVYVLHELVHNKFVSSCMRENGAVFVEDIKDIPAGAVAMIGAHGVGKDVEQEMQSRFTVVDTTCPRVRALQIFGSRIKQDQELVFLCKKGHPEAVGVLGHAVTEHIYQISDLHEAAALPDLKNPVFLSQTTMSGELVENITQVLKKRFPNLETHGSICDASSRRQRSAEGLAAKSDAVLVVGSTNSSNAAELVNVVERCGKKAWLVEDGNSVALEMLSCVDVLGLTAGASTPDDLIEDVKRRLVELGYSDGGVADV